MLTLSVLCFLLACSPKRIAEAVPTPPERLVCEAAGDRPALPPQYRVNRNVATLPAVWAEHDRYVSREIERNGIVAGYILTVEGRNFVCFNNMQWRREFEAGLPKAQPR